MTKLWVTARTEDEANMARTSGADIVNLFAQGGDNMGVNFIIDSARQKKRLVLCQWPCCHDHWPQQFSQWCKGGFDGVILETRGHLLSDISLTDLENFITLAHEGGLMVALSGALEPPDIPRLLRLSPDILCFARDNKTASVYFSQPALRQMIRSLIPHEGKKEGHGNMADCAIDRLIVRNFILPVEIGAYQHERGHKQRVRFNVFADVMRLSNNPQDMRHIVSYDLIMDAIRQLVTRGHVDLVETLAEEIASSVLKHEAVRHVVVRVEKLDLEPEAVGIEIERHKS